MLSKLIILFVLVAFGHGSTTMPDDKCLKVKPIEGFELTKILGDWYPQMMWSIEEVPKKCLLYRVYCDECKPNSTMHLKRIWENKNMNNLNMTEISDSSAFNIDWFKQNTYMWVVATDYDNWSLWHVCNPSNPKINWAISTRKRKYNETLVKKVQEIAKSMGYGFVVPNLKRMQQENCKN